MLMQLNEIEFIDWLKKSDKDISSLSDNLDTPISDYEFRTSIPYGETIILTKKLAKSSYGTIYLGKGKRFSSETAPLLIGVDNSGRISVLVELIKYGKSAYKVDTTVAKDGNTFPAHKVYALFVKSGYILVAGSQQSAGGQMIWRRLAKEPGINVHGWDKATNKPVNLGDDIEDEHDTHASFIEIASRQSGLKQKLKDKTLTAAEKAKIKNEYEKEIADLKYVKSKIMLVASATAK